MYLHMSYSLMLAIWVLASNLAVAQNTCSAQCEIKGADDEQVSRLGWMKYDEYTSTIVGITIIEIVNTDLGTTRTSTVTNEQVSISHTNSAGTVTQDITFTRGSQVYTTTIAFPTTFDFVPQTYVWSGILSTTGADGQSSCITASAATISIDYFSQPTTFTFPAGTGDDDRGWNWRPQNVVIGGPGTDVAESISTEDAIKYCSTTGNAPIVPNAGVAYVATTMTMSEAGTTSGASSEATSTSDHGTPMVSSSSLPTSSSGSSGGEISARPGSLCLAGILVLFQLLI